MKNMLLTICFSSLILGCASESGLMHSNNKPITNKIEIGTKDGAHSVIVINYHHAKASPEYQNYDVYLYLSKLPENNEFEICNFEYDGCDSRYSVWQNVLRSDQHGIWFNYDLKFPMQLITKQGVPLVTIKNLATQTFLEWDKHESLYKTNVYVSGEAVQQSSMTATAYQLL